MGLAARISGGSTSTKSSDPTFDPYDAPDTQNKPFDYWYWLANCCPPGVENFVLSCRDLPYKA
jgi:hypothetical protein